MFGKKIGPRLPTNGKTTDCHDKQKQNYSNPWARKGLDCSVTQAKQGDNTTYQQFFKREEPAGTWRGMRGKQRYQGKDRETWEKEHMTYPGESN